MHYHYVPQMPGDGTHAYCENHVPQSDLQEGLLVYVCDCENNTCVVCEELDIQRYERSSTYGKLENPQA